METLGCFPRSRPSALATAVPARVPWGCDIERYKKRLLASKTTPVAALRRAHTHKGPDTHFSIRYGLLVQRDEHGDAVYPVVADPIWFVPILVDAGVLCEGSFR